MGSHIHQQRYGRAKVSKGSSAKELQGAAAEDAALEVAATPLAKARRDQWLRWQQNILLQAMAEDAAGAAGVVGGAS